MRHISVGVVVFLLFNSTANGGPRDWVKKHPRFVAAATALVAASAVEWTGANRCQQGDVERCVSGYGLRTATKATAVGIGVAMLGASTACFKNDGPKPACYGLSYFMPVTQVALGIHDFVNYKPETTFNDTCGDFKSCVTVPTFRRKP